MKKFKNIVIGTAAICLLTPASLWAQRTAGDQSVSDLTLEQLLNVEVGTVFGASRYRQRVTDAPAAVSVITHEEIERFGYRTLADVLRGVRGFYVTNDRNYSYVGVRGFSRPGDYNTRVLMLLDGHRLNETIYDSAYIGEDFVVPMEMIERVEVIRGPGSSLYGTSAFLAVVNVVTRPAAAMQSVRASVDAGSLGRRGATVVFGHETANGAPLVLAASAAAIDGESSITVDGYGNIGVRDDEQSWKVYGSRGFGKWQLRGLFGERRKRIPTGAFGTDPADGRSRTWDLRGFVDLSYDGKWRGNTLFFRTAFDTYEYRGDYAYFPETDGGINTLTSDLAETRWWTSEVMLSRRVAERHFVTGGVEYRDNFQQDQFASDVIPDNGLYLEERHSSRIFAAFAQDEITVSKQITITAGLRHDRTRDLGSTNLRLAAIFKPSEKTALKLLHGSAFRAPNPYELYYYASPSLLPERIRTTEAVWEQYVGKVLRTSVSAFMYRAHDLITQVPTDVPYEFAFANIADAHAPGIELEAEATVRELHLLGSYTYQDVRTDAERRISNSPRNMVRSRVTGPVVPNRLFFGVEGLYTGDRDTLAGTVADGAFLGNVTLSSRQIAGATLTFAVGNLFNEKYADPGAEEHPGNIVQQVGRTMRAQVSWRF